MLSLELTKSEEIDAAFHTAQAMLRAAAPADPLVENRAAILLAAVATVVRAIDRSLPGFAASVVDLIKR